MAAELLRRDGQHGPAAAEYVETIAACLDGVEREHIIAQRATLDSPDDFRR